MGMYDYISKVDYPLPKTEAMGDLDQNKLDYQTKDLDECMEAYEIRSDGSLWYCDYDIEDQSQMGRWKKENPDKKEELAPPECQGLVGMRGCAARINQRWIPHDFTGEIRFYDYLDKEGWIEYSAYFVNGKLNQIHLIEFTAPKIPKHELLTEH